MEEARAMGEEVPDSVLPENEEFGGFAYELMFLEFRTRPPNHLLGEELDRYLEDEYTPKRERLVEIIEPSPGDWFAYGRAMQLLRRYERFDHALPLEGGWLDQPAEWIFVMEATLTARERAESLNNREEAAFHKQQSGGSDQTYTPSPPPYPDPYVVH